MRGKKAKYLHLCYVYSLFCPLNLIQDLNLHVFWGEGRWWCLVLFGWFGLRFSFLCLFGFFWMHYWMWRLWEVWFGGIIVQVFHQLVHYFYPSNSQYWILQIYIMVRNLREFWGELTEGKMPLLDASGHSPFPLFWRGKEALSLPISIDKLIVSHQVFWMQ